MFPPPQEMFFKKDVVTDRRQTRFATFKMFLSFKRKTAIGFFCFCCCCVCGHFNEN